MNRYGEGINRGCWDFVVGMLKSSWGWTTEGSQFDCWQGREFYFSPKTLTQIKGPPNLSSIGTAGSFLGVRRAKL
jgi:hypothetical protein